MSDPTPLYPVTAAEAFPEPPDACVYTGLAGEIVRDLGPHSEADPVALLGTLLAAAGNIVGTGPHYMVSGRKHGLRVYPVLVGETSSGRKGTSLGTLSPVLEAAFPHWWRHNQRSGLSSGEGLIDAVRDASYRREPLKDKRTGAVTDYQTVLDRDGIEDKRLFVVEEEFAGVIKVLARETNSLSTVIRQAWDGGALRVLTRHTAAVATDPHITILGHVTPAEIRRYLSDTELVNGFANRFLWLAVKRSKLLPHGGTFDDEVIVSLGRVLEETLTAARDIKRIRFDDDAMVAWEAVYERLTTPGDGVLGALAARAAPQVLRIAALYAVLDVSPRISAAHLQAALALWEYSAASLVYVFTPTADAPPAERAPKDVILAALRERPHSQTEISALFNRNKSKAELSRLLNELKDSHFIVCDWVTVPGAQRQVLTWKLSQRLAPSEVPDA